MGTLGRATLAAVLAAAAAGAGVRDVREPAPTGPQGAEPGDAARGEGWLGAPDDRRRGLIGPVPAPAEQVAQPAVDEGAALPPADVETFALWPSGAGPADPPIGALRHVRVQRPGGAWQVEQDLVLFEPGLRVHLVERHGAATCQLTHRELAPGAGRTLRAHWPQRGARPPLGAAERLRDWEPAVVQWSGTERRVARYPGARGWSGPLGLIEQQRWGLLGDGEAVRFEPLAGRPERLSVSHAGFGFWRWYRWTGTSGEPRGWMVYWKQELVALAWQDGGPRARRIRPDLHGELVSGH